MELLLFELVFFLLSTPVDEKADFFKSFLSIFIKSLTFIKLKDCVSYKHLLTKSINYFSFYKIKSTNVVSLFLFYKSY